VPVDPKSLKLAETGKAGEEAELFMANGRFKLYVLSFVQEANAAQKIPHM